MPAQNLRNITLGPVDIKLYNEGLGGCFAAGCLSTVRITMGRNMLPIVCNVLDGVAEYRPLDPSAQIAFSAKELTSIMLAHGAGDGARIVGGSSIDVLVGPAAGADSTVASPCEWHLVKLSGTAPWTFSMYLENRDLWYTGSNFIQDTDISLYLAASTNGDTAVAKSTVALDMAASPANNTWKVTDACAGKITFTAFADASVSQFTYDANAAPITINGVYPIIESDVKHGDTVALIGFAYLWGKVVDASGTLVDRANRTKIEVGDTLGEPIAIKAVHLFQADRKRKALIFRIWKARNMAGASLGFDSESTRQITMDTSFMAINDKKNHPNSPFGEIEIVDATSDLNIETLL